jgi:hypothetical protein
MSSTFYGINLEGLWSAQIEHVRSGAEPPRFLRTCAARSKSAPYEGLIDGKTGSEGDEGDVSN